MYQLVFCEAVTGIILNSNGQYSNQNKRDVLIWEFENLDDAINLKDELLNKYVFGEVSILDLKNGKENSFYNDIELEIYLKEKQIFESWATKSWISKLFKSKPILKYF